MLLKKLGFFLSIHLCFEVTYIVLLSFFITSIWPDCKKNDTNTGHSSEIRGLFLMKVSSETFHLVKLSSSKYTNSLVDRTGPNILVMVSTESRP